jgi:hypothetical protein
VIDLEYFTLSGPCEKYIGDTLTYLRSTWGQREDAMGVSWAALEAVARQVGRTSNRKRMELQWPREISWAFMTPDGVKVLWDCNEVHMPLSHKELVDKTNSCSSLDRGSAHYLSTNIHYLPWHSADAGNTHKPLEVFQRFVHFCREVGAQRIFLKGNTNEADRLRSWLRLADASFDLPVVNSADWRYIAPKYKTPEFLKRYATAVKTHLTKHHHGSANYKGDKYNQHCSGVECLYYATHYKFKSEKQDWRKRPYPAYKNIALIGQEERKAIREQGKVA